MTNLCTFPSCGERLYPRNTSGVCRNHTHAFGYCKCQQCDPNSHLERKRQPPPPPKTNIPPPVPDPEPAPLLLVPDPETATFAELCAPLSAKIRSRRPYNWGSGIGSVSNRD